MVEFVLLWYEVKCSVAVRELRKFCAKASGKEDLLEPLL